MKAILNTIATTALVCLVVTSFHAQDPSLKRIEFEVEGDEVVKFYSAGEYGVLSIQYGEEKNRKEKSLVWKLDMWDTDLKKVWSKEILVDKDHYFKEADLDGSTLYMISLGDITKNRDIGFFKLDLETGDYQHFTSEMPYAYLGESVANNGSLYFAGSTALTPKAKMVRGCASLCLCYIPICFGAVADPMELLVYRVDYDNQRLKLLPSQFEEKASPVAIVPRNDGKQITNIVTLSPKGGDGNPYMVLRRYDEKDSKISDTKLKTSGSKVPLNARLKEVNAREEIMIGTYYKMEKPGFFAKAMMNLMRKSTGATQFTNSADGMFFTKLENGEQSFIKFYDFKEFQAFYNVLSEKTKKKLEKKRKKKKDKIEDVLSSYQLLFHDIEKVGDEFIVVAEAYYPEYHTETHTSYDANGNMTTTTVQVFDGYRYTHCIVSAFNDEGDLLWEDAFPIKEILSFVLKERVRLLTSGKDIVVAYNYAGAIQSTVFRDGKKVSTKTGSKIDTGEEGDELKSMRSSDLFYWYDNYFLATGAQTVKSTLSRSERKEKDLDRKRTIYYMNKIVFD